jgi:hypothetical protein
MLKNESEASHLKDLLLTSIDFSVRDGFHQIDRYHKNYLTLSDVEDF